MKILYLGKLFLVILFLIFLLSSLYTFAYGGGGSGGLVSGLGFGSRDSVYILVIKEYSEKFSLKNATKYNLKITVEDNKTNVSFGYITIGLVEGDNYVDLDDDEFANINFKLEQIKEKSANVRIIRVKDKIRIINKKPIFIIDRPKSEEEGGEEELKCGNLPSLRERISCRLDIKEEEQEEDLELYYLPEECGVLSGRQRGLCIARYKSVQTCWKFPVGDARISCVKRTTDLGFIQKEKETCNALTGQERSDCVRELKNKVYNLIKWRFYDLEERAEDFMIRGVVSKEEVIKFIEKTEKNKILFNQAKTKDERKNIILYVRDGWKEFTNIVKENMKG